MNIRKTFLTAAGVAMVGVGVASAQANLDIVDTAVEAGTFNTLVAAVQAAGLVDTLKGEGPFTVFAPTDEAFAALPEGTVDNLLLPENIDQLVAVLTYHVVPGRVMSADIAGQVLDVATVEGATIHIDATDGVTVNGANVIAADVVATNGVIHVIDTVLLPPAGLDIVNTAIEAGTFSTLVAAVQAAGLVDVLKGDGPFTVFAPTDEAFAALPEGTVETLLRPENIDMLVAILTYHVVSGKVMSADIAGQMLDVATVEGATIHIDATDGVTVNGAHVVAADVVASNGVIHVIDAVLLPPTQ